MHRTRLRIGAGAALLAVLAVGIAVPVAAQGSPSAPSHYTCFGKPATIVGGAGADVLNGTPFDDVIVGLGGNDIIHGRGGNDLICGGPGDDYLFGDDGKDRIFGDLGYDYCNGGPPPMGDSSLACEVMVNIP
jgi:Ca2+-binding RTX toxin-like protein